MLHSVISFDNHYTYLTKLCDVEGVMKGLASAATKKGTHEEKILEAQMRKFALRRREYAVTNRPHWKYVLSK